MAAETIVGNVVTEILKNLSLLITQEISLAWGVKEDLKKLQKTVNTILDVIADAEKRQVKEEVVRRWLQSLKDLAYEADDILDDFSYERMRRDDQLKCKGDKVHKFFLSSNPLIFRFKMASKIKDINRKFDEIVEQKIKFHLQVVIDMGPSNTMTIDNHVIRRGNKETYSFVNLSKIVGRENDKKKILEMLMNADGPDSDRISVIPIVGMGGLGKTTLAKLVYDADSVKKQFEPRLWVCVSDVFDLRKILRDLINAIHTENKCDDISSTQVMVSKLQEKLSEKKYLLVLDDMWNENVGEWTTLKDVLEVGAIGSKVIVTTRKSKVASIVRGKPPPYVLHGLSEDECWSVFEQTVGDEIVNQNMAAIGREMVKKCKGLPLAITVLGGVMRSRKEEHEWRSIRNNEIWDTLLEDQNSILPILKLSYDHLPLPLKECFSYCAIFPKDFDFERKILIQLWSAEGFLDQKNNKEMEDIGNEYFHSLLRNCLFQDVKKDTFGNIVSCKMHDLLHDLAQTISGNNVLATREARVIKTGCGEGFRLCLVLDDDNSLVLKNFKSKQKLRTCLVGGTGIGVDKSIIGNVCGAKCLRVLDLSWIGVEELPSSVGKLKHLRYLDLSGNPELRILPDSITKLYNLETLILHRCNKLEVLPRDVGSLKKLRYLDLSDTSIRELPESITALTYLHTLNLGHCSDYPKDFNKLTQLRHLICEGFKKRMPRGLGRLSNLQTLWLFRVAEEDMDGCCGIGELEHLNLLRGKLKINNLEYVKDGFDAQRANLKGKWNIDELVLQWGSRRSCGFDNDEVDLKGLQPHHNLKKLTILYFMGVKLPTWLGVSTTTSISPFLPNLVEIKLGFFGRCEQLSGLGKLPSLKKLFLWGMVNLEKWEEEEEASSTPTDKHSLKPALFPCLEKLNIFECPDLRITPALFPSLKYLTVNKSNSMGVRSLVRRSSHLTSLTYLNISSTSSELKFLPLDLLQPKLQSLEILKCPKFKGFVKNQEEMCISFFDAPSSYSYLRDRLTSLTKLRIHSEGFPVAVGGLASLEQLYIRCSREEEEDDEGKLIQQQQQQQEEEQNWWFRSLRTLEIDGCFKLKSLPQQIQHATNLQKLEIYNMGGDMVSLPEWVGNLSSLRCLGIHNCFQLTSLQSEQAMRGLTSLEKLRIDGISETANNFPAEGIQHLVFLRELYISASSDPSSTTYDEDPNISSGSNLMITSLPHQLQHLTTLKRLSQRGFNGLLELPEWLGNLSSLQRLEIWDCENLKCLPSEAAMKRLTALSYLYIQRCHPLLKNRCKEGTGEEWYKISHIKFVRLLD